jgi:Rrf2 family nitric oxide-sensitive transcriptional repressor
MRLTRFTDYALRVLIYLGVTEERSVTVNELAQAYGISRNHLVKIVHRLGTLGYIETMRGKNGGMRLAHDAADIHLGDVVRKFEEDMTIVECFNTRTNTCPIEPGCALQGILRTATGQFMAELDRYTLADLTRSRRRLRPLLRIPKRS